MFPELTRSVFDGVVGQSRAIAQLRHAATTPVHAYLFVGPSGSTKDHAARAFAALLLSGLDDPADRHARLALDGIHPDVRELRRDGAQFLEEQIKEIIRIAALAPQEGSRTIVILHEFHLIDAPGATRLLKSVEEPPDRTLFVILADQVTPELVTIASRCVRIDFDMIDDETIRSVLLAAGVPPDRAALATTSASGDLDRARLLAADESLARRRHAFAAVPRRLDGTGSRVVELCRELGELIDAAAEPLAARQADEIARLDEQVKLSGERGSGRKRLEERHRREIRKHRTDELRSGLTIIAGVYRDALVAGTFARPDAAVDAVHRVNRATAALGRNPNDTLLLQSLLLDLPSMAT